MSKSHVVVLCLLLALALCFVAPFAKAQNTNQTAVLKESISLTGPVMWLM